MVIKSLAISQVIHIFNSIPISDNSVKEIENIFNNFLWNGNTNKVKSSVIIQDYQYGGLKMADVKSILTAQKLKWIKMYLNNHKCLWRYIMESLINVENLNMFLRGNFDRPLACSDSNFYQELLCHLYELNRMNLLNNNEDVINQYVFYNKNVVINGRMIYDKQLLDAGIWRISDLFDEKGNTISFNEWKSKGVCKSKFMLWRCLISKIRSLNLVFANRKKEYNNDIYIHFTNNIVNIEDCKSRELYVALVKNKNKIPTAQAKYLNLLQNLTDNEIRSIYLNPRKCTTDNNIKDFQFKILHRFLPTNALLYKMKKIPTNKCTFCEIHEESIVHLMYECICIRNIWSRVETILERVTGERKVLNCFDVLFGIDTKKEENSPVNNFILHVKYYMWTSKCTAKTPTYDNLIIYLSKRKLFENELVPFCDEFT